MANALLLLTVIFWIGAGICGLSQRIRVGRDLLVVGAAAAILAAILSLPAGTAPYTLPTHIAGEIVTFHLRPEALWLLGFGLVPAVVACALGSPSAEGQGGWQFGVALSLISALGVFGLENGAALLIAWEAMSLGGAVMILSEKMAPMRGRAVLFMLALLELGAIALMLVVAVLAVATGSLDFAAFTAHAANLSPTGQIGIGLLVLLGFGAKLGLLPFYEWFPSAYASGSGASGTILSGVVMNAAFFALSRSLLDWLPPSPDGVFPILATIVLVVATVSAILTILYAFQQDDWRELLSFSSAENASIAVVALGAALLLRNYRLYDLAGLAWTVALLHLAGHSLAKGAMFLTADGLRLGNGDYAIKPSRANAPWLLGLGALVGAMSLAAMPPTVGFMSEWFVFQTLFQGFHLPNLGGRLLLALAGAGLALTAAVAFATFVKVLGIGLLGRAAGASSPAIAKTYSFAVGFLGLAVLLTSVGMPAWLSALDHATAVGFGTSVSRQMHDGLLLVPLTAKFAFISPSLLIVVMPLLALIPIALVVGRKRYPVRRSPVWYGGLTPDMAKAATTALTFSNAMRTFYSFVYRPTEDTERQADAGGYFVRKLVFEHDVAPVFGPWLFQPAIHAVRIVAGRLRLLQSGYLNFYLGLIGILLVLILGLTLV
ncbi:hydrogenase 4 subunit B [Labrys sp. WJW]|uniref:proton-conducting transporter transmembrane domain-containing protein n=1 Tax=Labrys sp. WJW TaxID=1737983 RepID=UPI00082ACA96|nr:proton-conducting transporter membrane subunit [Labrys sp. WJW]OCC05449.1 hydrogenase 4 subunit B [Labrys sp. WJW]